MIDAAVLAAFVTGLFTLVGVIITVIAGNKKIEHKLEINQAVQDTKLDNLTQEVRRHNNFAEKIPAMETKITTLEHDVAQLQKFHMTSN